MTDYMIGTAVVMLWGAVLAYVGYSVGKALWNKARALFGFPRSPVFQWCDEWFEKHGDRLYGWWWIILLILLIPACWEYMGSGNSGCPPGSRLVRGACE